MQSTSALAPCLGSPRFGLRAAANRDQIVWMETKITRIGTILRGLDGFRDCA